MIEILTERNIPMSDFEQSTEEHGTNRESVPITYEPAGKLDKFSPPGELDDESLLPDRMAFPEGYVKALAKQKRQANASEQTGYIAQSADQDLKHLHDQMHYDEKLSKELGMPVYRDPKGDRLYELTVSGTYRLHKDEEGNVYTKREQVARNEKIAGEKANVREGREPQGNVILDREDYIKGMEAKHIRDVSDPNTYRRAMESQHEFDASHRPQSRKVSDARVPQTGILGRIKAAVGRK